MHVWTSPLRLFFKFWILIQFYFVLYIEMMKLNLQTWSQNGEISTEDLKNDFLLENFNDLIQKVVSLHRPFIGGFIENFFLIDNHPCVIRSINWILEKSYYRKNIFRSSIMLKNFLSIIEWSEKFVMQS